MVWPKPMPPARQEGTVWGPSPDGRSGQVGAVGSTGSPQVHKLTNPSDTCTMSTGHGSCFRKLAGNRHRWLESTWEVQAAAFISSVSPGSRGVCVPAKSLSRVWPFETLWAVAHEAPLSMGFSRQEYWSGLPCPSPGDLPDPRIEPASLMSPALAGRFCTTGATGKLSLG